MLYFLKEIFNPKMLVWYIGCGLLGWLIGIAVGYPMAGAVIGASLPLLVVIAMLFIGVLFVEMLISLFTGGRRR